MFQGSQALVLVQGWISNTRIELGDLPVDPEVAQSSRGVGNLLLEIGDFPPLIRSFRHQLAGEVVSFERLQRRR